MSFIHDTSDPRCLDLPEPVVRRRSEGLICPEGDACGAGGPDFLLSAVLAVALHGCVFVLLASLGMGAGLARGIISVSLLPAGVLSGHASGPGSGTPAGSVESGGDASHARDASGPAADVMPVKKPEAPEGRDVAQDAPVKEERARRSAPLKKAVKLRKARTKVSEPPPEVAKRSAPDSEPAETPPASTAGNVDSLACPGHGAGANATGVAKAGNGPASGMAAGGGAEGPRGSAFGAGAGSGPVSAGFGASDGPRFVRRVQPRYPELARRGGREGRVVLRLVIGTGGELKGVEVVEGGGYGFEKAALAAVRASEYAPAVRGGRPVECAALLPIRFSLRGS